MRWTDGSGPGYGEEPYAGAGHTYAHGHVYAHDRAYTYDHQYGHEYAHGREYRGGVTTDTTSPPWDGVPPVQWTHPTEQTTTAWEFPHGDVLAEQHPVFETEQHPVLDTAQLAVLDTHQLPVFDGAPGHPVPEPDTSQSESARPVFVDSSGRRQRRVLRAARLLVIPAGGYVAVLISTMLGGPSISSPFVPHADSAHSATPTATAPDSSSSSSDAGHPARSTSPTAAREASGPTDRSASSTAPTAPSRPTAAPTTTAAPTPTATSAPSSRGRGLGSSHKRVK
ncbi:hypothetical protein AB0C96_00830 [Streptomyces sp. NPDC048506]|uniref:hypothetical protein n=1 Tax=Streptomyces sp. NPDC048506 TaxID=3155028 RepID=UPI003421607E